MCNYSDYVERSARKEGIKQGEENAEEKYVLRLSSKGKDAAEIADLLDLTVEKVKEILQGSPATV